MPKVCGQTLLQLRQPMHENSSTKACGRAAKALEGTAPAQCSPQRSPCPTSLHLRRALNAALALPCKPRRQLCRQQCKSHTALQSCLQTATCARRRTALQACLQHPTVMPQLSVGSPASCLLRGQAAHVVPLIRRVHKGVHGAVREARQRVVGGALLRVQQRLRAGPRGASGADRAARGAPCRVHASSRAYLLNKQGLQLAVQDAVPHSVGPPPPRCRSGTRRRSWRIPRPPRRWRSQSRGGSCASSCGMPALSPARWRWVPARPQTRYLLSAARCLNKQCPQCWQKPSGDGAQRPAAGRNPPARPPAPQTRSRASRRRRRRLPGARARVAGSRSHCQPLEGGARAERRLGACRKRARAPAGPAASALARRQRWGLRQAW
jgi:hypothetical protein